MKLEGLWGISVVLIMRMASIRATVSATNKPCNTFNPSYLVLYEDAANFVPSIPGIPMGFFIKQH